jgi:hypothetical protein
LEAFSAVIERSGFLLKPSKCRIDLQELTFLGRHISLDGICLQPDDRAAIVTWLIPRDAKKLQ